MKTPNEIQDLPLRYYPPSDSMELYDEDTDTYYNAAGQELRDPKEYNPHNEGYTPFGDE
jgi:hypothetical protein